MSWNSIPATIWLEKAKDVEECVDYLRAAKDIAFDEESSGLSIIKDYPIMFSMSDGIKRFGGMAELLHAPSLKALLEDPTIPKIGSNLKIDLHWAANIGVNIDGPIYDTVNMDWLVDENRQGRHGLKECAWDHCGIKMREFKEVFPMKRRQAGVPNDTAKDAIYRKIATKEGFEEAKHYAGLDAYANVHVKVFLERKMRETFLFEGSSWSLFDHFCKWEAPFSRVLYNMERRGITVSTGYFKQLESVAKKKLIVLETEINTKLGYPLNIKSPPQLRKLFYESLGKPVLKWTDGGQGGNKAPSTDIDVLKGWADDGDELASLIIEHRTVSKLLNTYIQGLQEHVDRNGRIHSFLKQSGTVTGRLSSTEPNLQNLPRMAGDIFKLRDGFISRPGYVLIDADFSQLELMLMAHKSKDENLLRAINEGKDIHCYGISLIFPYTYEQAVAAKKAGKSKSRDQLTTDEKILLNLRDAIKSTGYGLIYGIGSDKLSIDLTKTFRKSDPTAKNKQCPKCLTIYDVEETVCEHKVFITKSGIESFPIDNRHISSKTRRQVSAKISDLQRKNLINEIDFENITLVEVQRTVSQSEAASYIDAWFSAFPRVKEYIDEQRALVRKQGFVQTFLGRLRRLPSIFSAKYLDQLEAERQANNTVQGDASDILKVVMLEIERDPLLKELGFEMLLQIHDEIIGEIPDDEEITKKGMDRLQYIMEKAFDEQVFPLLIKLLSEPSFAYSWGSAKG